MLVVHLLTYIKAVYITRVGFASSCVPFCTPNTSLVLHITPKILAPRHLLAPRHCHGHHVQALAQKLQHLQTKLWRFFRPSLFHQTPLLKQRTDILVAQAKGKLLMVTFPRQALMKLVT